MAQHENAVFVKADTIHGAVYDELATELTGEVVDNTKDPRARYNWFADVAFGGGFYAAESNRFANNPMSRMRPQFQVSVGKWVLPHWAVRAAFGYGTFSYDNIGINVWNLYDEGDHFTIPDDAKPNYWVDENGKQWFHRKFNMVDAQLDLVYDFNRIFTKRVTPFDVYIYGGVSYSHSFASCGINAGDALGFKAGIDVHYKVTKNFYIKGGFEGTIADESLDGEAGGFDTGNRTVEGYAQAFIGVGLNFGKGKKMQKYVYTVPNTIERTYLTTQAPLGEDYTAPFVVRFFIDQYNIESDQELNIAKVGKYLQEHPSARLKMTGHADPETASSAYNQKLSERRCKAVLNYLDKNYGISHNRIDVKPMGDTERNFNEDFRWNRCVILTIIDK